MLKKDQSVRNGEWEIKDVEILNRVLFLTAKNTVYMVNLSSEDYIRKTNKWMGEIEAWVQSHGGGEIIPYSIEFEKEVMGMEAGAKEIFLRERKTSSMIEKILETGYHALQLIHFFTVGEDEVKCWTVRQGTKAPKAAGVIHTDFEKGFICAEVKKYADFAGIKTENAAKAVKKMKQYGKEYVVEDGDIINFKFNSKSRA